MYALIPLLLALALQASADPDPWKQAEENGKQTQKAVMFCNHFVSGWLTHADPVSGLIPRNLKTDAFWNAKDSAADNYPFMVLSCAITGHPVLMTTMRTMLEKERALTSRLDSLPDDFLFKTQAFRTSDYKLDDLIFGAAEYAKDGLIPVTEWMGPSPWLERMEEMIHDIWKHASYDSPAGKIPAKNVEVVGDLLQTMSRLYWMTGKEEYREWAFQLADCYLLNDNIPEWERLQLDDHGCEIIGGLSEVYLIASKTDSQRWISYRPKIHAIIDRVARVGRNADGLFYNVVNARTGQALSEELTDNWGYTYNAFLTVAQIDGIDEFRDPVRKALDNILSYTNYKWENGGADGYADSIEGCINLLNRLPNEKALRWVDESMAILLSKQRHDGIIEGWHGDGNSARTTLMWALMKTQGVAPSPWREDLVAGAVRDTSGSLCLWIQTEWPWSGTIRFDRPRHKEYLHMPWDYPRLNQFPEWFTVERDRQYRITVEGQPPVVVKGSDLWQYPLEIPANATIRMTVTGL